MPKIYGSENIIGSLLIAIAIVIVGVLGYLAALKAFKDNAIDRCYQTARIEKTSGGQSLSTPENYWFDQCMKKKGY